MAVRKNRYGQFHYGESYYYAPIPLNVGEGSISVTSKPLLIFEVPPVFVGEGTVNIQSLLSTMKFYIPLYVTKDNTMPYLDIRILRDSRYDIIPETKEIVEVIPGKHGEIYFKSKLRPRIIELHVASPEFSSMEEKEEWKRKVAGLLQETTGKEGRPLIFENDITKTYQVKYSGRIDLNQYWNWTEFVIPFKSTTPYILGTFQRKLNGSGIAVNSGNHETPIVITIHADTADVVNPSFTVAETTVTYTGTIPNGETLTIDTEKMTVDLEGENAVAGHNGKFPMLQPGETEITVSGNGVFTFYWYDRWV